MQGFGINELEVGQTASITRLVDDEARARASPRCPAISNPLHMDEEYAARTPFRGRIAHGALIASYISLCPRQTICPVQGAVFAGMTMRFERPVRIGDTVIACATVTSIDIKQRRVMLECVCEVNGEACMKADAEVMVRKRRASSE